MLLDWEQTVPVMRHVQMVVLVSKVRVRETTLVSVRLLSLARIVLLPPTCALVSPVTMEALVVLLPQPPLCVTVRPIILVCFATRTPLPVHPTPVSTVQLAMLSTAKPTVPALLDIQALPVPPRLSIVRSLPSPVATTVRVSKELANIRAVAILVILVTTVKPNSILVLELIVTRVLASLIHRSHPSVLVMLDTLVETVPRASAGVQTTPILAATVVSVLTPTVLLLLSSHVPAIVLCGVVQLVPLLCSVKPTPAATAEPVLARRLMASPARTVTPASLVIVVM